MPKVILIIETESSMAYRGPEGGENEELFHEDRVSVWEDEKILEMYGGDDCTTIASLMPFNCTLKNGKFCDVYFKNHWLDS